MAGRVRGQAAVGPKAIPRRTEDRGAGQPARRDDVDRHARHACQLGSDDGPDVHLVADDDVGPIALDLRAEEAGPQRSELGDEVLTHDHPLELSVHGHERLPVAVQGVGTDDDRLEAESGEARHHRPLSGERDAMTIELSQPRDREQRLGVTPSADEGRQDAHVSTSPLSATPSRSEPGTRP